jgi:hypothetical protein
MAPNNKAGDPSHSEQKRLNAAAKSGKAPKGGAPKEAAPKKPLCKVRGIVAGTVPQLGLRFGCLLLPLLVSSSAQTREMRGLLAGNRPGNRQ